ncbi:hypothetical protein [Paenibacillus luteus]|uniref:hypothetical protein n=1 Tax=Paenibacillus luteus TaxID=2545753 RepID=UPI0011428FCE|nr:hypothetical protein [Paenibacillus luteus]
MSWHTLITIWVLIGGYGIVNPSWKKHDKKEKKVLFSLLFIAFVLSLGLGLNPNLPSLTDWVNALYRPLHGWLSP